MNTRTTRLTKEVRAILAPWCVVTLIGAAPLLITPFRPDADSMGTAPFFIFGIAFLCTASLASEFQHRTISVLLTQPVHRMQILNEKLAVSLIAAVSAALVFCIEFWQTMEQVPVFLWFLAGAIVTFTASATFWTLTAKSVLGSSVLNLNAAGLFLGGGILLTNWLRDPARVSMQNAEDPSILIPALLLTVFVYAPVMFWLGRRKFAHFEVQGATASSDLLDIGHKLAPEWIGRFFVCDSRQPIRNLIRKEMHFLRPLVPLILLCILAMICLVPFKDDLEEQMLIPLSLWVATVITGVLPIGEERALGMQSSLLTLPISVRTQWFMKLFMGVLSSILYSGSVFIAGSVLGLFDLGDMRTAGLLSLLCIPAFWCASAAGGTVKATLLFYPAVGTLVLIGTLASRIGQGFANTGGLADFIVSRLHPYPVPMAVIYLFAWDWTLVLCIAVPTVLAMLMYSYKWFRVETQDSASSIIRRVAPVGLVTFLCSVSFGVVMDLVSRPFEQAARVTGEIHASIEKLPIDLTALDAAHPTVVRLDDVPSLSGMTQRWIRTSRITVSPNTRRLPIAVFKNVSPYVTTLHLANGTQCSAYGDNYWNCFDTLSRPFGNYPLAQVIQRVTP